jgi:hypothetical protein
LSTTVAEILDAYLDGLTSEREFDAPFVALLRGVGFYDVHFLHGAWEFGKDFIAKRSDDGTVVQYAFQTKGGDIGLNEWRGSRAQIDEMRRNILGHPHFDQDLPRKAVFVTTGRLVGAAPMEAQEYRRGLIEVGELTFELWERPDLVDLLQQSPLFGLTPRPALSRALLDVGDGLFLDSGPESATRIWTEDEFKDRPWAAAIEAAVLAGALARVSREELAAAVAEGVVRAGSYWGEVGGSAWDPLEMSRIGRRMFSTYATAVWERCGQDDLDPVTFINKRAIPHGFVGYPIAALKVANLLSLLVLLQREEARGPSDVASLSAGDPADSHADNGENVASFLAHFVGQHPGVAHPISDRWATPLLNVIAANAGDRGLIESLLRDAATWTLRHYDNGLGLAGWAADEATEVGLMLGAPLAHIEAVKRTQSYLVAVILDACAMFQLESVYEDVRSDVLALRIAPTALEVPDNESQYVRDHPDIRQTPGLAYRPYPDAIQESPSAVHDREPSLRSLIRAGRPWDLLAVADLLRDRHFMQGIRELV